MTRSLTAAIIDDNPDDAQALERDLRKLEGFDVASEHYLDAESGLDGITTNPVDIVFLDYRLQGESHTGIGVLEQAEEAGVSAPFIMLTGQGDEYIAAKSIRAGAADYLVKGRCNLKRLEQTITRVLRENKTNRREQRAHAEVKKRLSLLTTREREVLEQLIAGKTSKQIAGAFYRSEQTIKIHRANLMKKMQAETPAHLTRLALSVKGERKAAATK